MEKIDFAAISEDVARHLLGEPNRRLSGRHELRFGSKGAIALNTRAGQFFDHEAQEGGGVLHLIRHVEGGDPWQWLADRGFVEDRSGRDYTAPDLIEMQRRAAERDAERRKRDAQTEAEEKRKRELAARIWREARPIEGTPAETYLRGRAITSWPEDCARWHPAAPSYPGDPDPRAAIVFPFTDALGDVVAVMAVRLTPEGKKISDEIAKKTLGPMRKGRCILPGDGPLHLAEGPETALSVWLATGAPVMICGTAISARHVEQAPAGPLILCSDAAPDGAAVAMALAGATGAAVARGLPCAVAVPNGPDKTDWNDLLQAQGAKAVASAIAEAVTFTPGDDKEGVPLPVLPDVVDARAEVKAALDGFWTGIQDAASFDVLQVPTGVGKTRAAIEMTGQAIAEMRARFDFSAVCMYAPDHKLNDQILADFAKYAPGVTATVRRGRTAENPDRPGEKMCRNLEAAQRAEKFLLDVKKTVCASCPFEAGCAYLESQSKKADVYILPHASLDKKPPAAVKSFEQGLAFAVIDETPGPTGQARKIAVAAFEGMRATQRGRGDDALSREADLRAWRACLAGVIRDNGEGPLRADLVRLAFDAETLSDAVSAEWNRKIDDADRSEDELEQNRTIPRMAAIWKELAAMLKDGRPVTARLMVFNDAEAGLSVRVRSVLKLDDELEKAPRVLLDATANRSLIEMALGPVDQWHDIEAGAPHMRIAQDATVSMSKSMLQTDFDGYGTDLAQSAARNNRQHLIKLVRKQARLYPGQTGLVVTYKATAEAIRPHMPEGVTVMHFGATRGRNDAEAVRWVLIAGRPLTKDYAVIEMAETLTGLPVESRSEMMQSQRLYTDGAQQWAAPCEVRGYPDPVAQSCMEAIRDAELVQTVGRGRGVNRSAQDPLDILVVGDGFLPFAVHDAGGTWKAITKRDFIEDQLEAGGIAYAGSGAAFAAYGTALSPTEKALRKEIERLGDIPLIDTYRGLSPSPLEVFRLKRNKRAPVWTKAYIDTGRHADPRAAVEAQLGPLAMFEPDTSLKAGNKTEVSDIVKSSFGDPARVIRPARRLVIVPEAERIDSAILADHVARRGVKREPGPGVPLVPDLPFPHRSWWKVIADLPFLLWRARDAMPARELVPI